MASRLILPFADVGRGITPSDGAQLFFFDTNANTLRDTWADKALTTLNTNPVIANADGVFPDIWISGTYKIQLKDKNDVLQNPGEWDPVEDLGDGSSITLDINGSSVNLEKYLDSIDVASYDDFRTDANGFEIASVPDGTTINFTNDGIAGPFVAKSGAATDNAGTIIVSSVDSNRYVERDYTGEVEVEWFEPDGVNDTVAFQAAIDTLDNVVARTRKSYLLTTTPIMRTSGQQLKVFGQLVLGGASGTAALQIGDSASGDNVDFAKVWIQRIDGQDNTAGRDAIRYDYAVTCEVHIQRIINCQYGHHMRMFSTTGRYIHNDVTGNIISSCQIGVYQQNAVGGVTELDNEGNDFRINIITGSVVGAFIVEPNVRGNGSLVMCNFDAEENYYINDSAFGQPNILICTDWPEDQTATGGTSDGSTAVITGLSDTSVFVAGCYVTISAGFPSTIEGYKVVSVDSASQITVDTNSDSVASGTITVRRTNVFADRDVIVGDGLVKIGRRPSRVSFLDIDVSDAASNASAVRFFDDGLETGRLGHNFSRDLSLETVGGQQLIAREAAGVILKNRISFDGQIEITLGAGNNNDVNATAQTSTWIATADGAGSTVTGITGGDEGRILKIYNVSANTLTISNDNAASGSGNRIISGTGANIVLNQNDVATLGYDIVSTRWRVESYVN